MMRDQMKLNDLAFFYHSACETPGIVGMMKIVREGYPDFTAFDRRDSHYDPKSDPDNPRWYMVNVRFERRFQRIIALTELKQQPELADMSLLRRGNRLSVMPVDAQHWRHILSLE